ncbi:MULTISPECIES: energy transducer TonB [unclassified Pseudomonas]|uniref:energy transducer TonB n=2 Tax=Gammaproteobacteria TaxID=1236 RepID=UPI0011EE5784|nr:MULTISPECIES: energy transducer TonB [unclassified Pseudomonas]KAA0942277.1 TonB family protein [Pseudomonas sp. ANT_H4]KAA0952674.1 TonB family protein [Pseudomonas sp. ANT_H14]
MTAMIMHSPCLTVAPREFAGLWKNSLAAGLAVALHVVVLALLMLGWSPEKPSVEPPSVMHTQLVMLAPAPVLPEMPAAVEPAPVEPAVSVPVKPVVDPQVQAQKLEKAALAHKRVADKKLEQQRQQQETEQRNHELEQQRVAQEQAQQQARLAADHARQQAAAQAVADSRQYLPLSKEAPDYPERALDKNIEGDCSVQYTVNPQGKVENPKVLDGCHPLFIRPSLAAANTFRYQPRVVDGKAVSVPAVRNTFHYRIK